MKKYFLHFLFLTSLLSPLLLSAQELKVTQYDPPIPYMNNNGDWGTDLVVSNSEPFGKFSGVYRSSNSTIYLAVPDTNISAGKCLVILSSTNNGSSWSIYNTVSPAVIIPKVKMVSRPGSDSLYCFFIVGSTLYSWNIINNNFNTFTTYTNIRDFDVTISSTGSLYLIIDLITNGDVRLYGSVNGGILWAGAVYLSAGGERPTIYMSGTGDTALINYYGTPFTDTVSSIIRSVRYRESVPGTLSVVGSFSSPVPAGTPKNQFKGILEGSRAWLFYTSGTTGNIDLNCISSTDGGTTYGAPFTIGSQPSRDEYWFDARHYSIGVGGVDLIYYSDSLQGGGPTNSSDKMYYTYAANSSPSTFVTSTQFSENPPGWSARGYIPALIEYYDAGGDLGAAWVSNNKVYFDRFSSIVGIHNISNETPKTFSLSQNYPNPFNPTTQIHFSVPKNSLVTLKVYDIIGREVAVLADKEFITGSYSINFDASSLASGVYFYKLVSGDFTETKKMMLVK